jgi:hypothetical protein
MQNALKNPIVAGLVATIVTTVAKMLDDKFITGKKSGTWKQYVKCGLFVGFLVAAIVYAIVSLDDGGMVVGGGGGGVPQMHQQMPAPMPTPAAAAVAPQGLLRDPF